MENKSIERLDFTEETSYNAIEAAIHLNRYSIAKPFCKNAYVLDAACGEGYGSYLLKSWGAKKVEGIDIDAASVERAKNLFKDENLHYIQNKVEKLPFEDNVFDLIVSLETIEHIDNVESFLKEMKRVLRPGGTIILSCPNDNYYFEKDNIENPFHKRAYTFFEFKELAEKYLGSHAEYYLGFAVDGFMNLPFEKRTEPEDNIKEDMLSMFQYVECEQVFCLPQERYLNQWNSNYYIGIWGKNERVCKYNAVISPREFFVNHKDKDYDLLYHLRKFQDEYEFKINNLRKEYEQQNNSVVELDRLRILLELAQKERNEAQKHMMENWEYYQNALKERDQNWEYYQQALTQLTEIRSSLCFRMLKTFDRIMEKIKGLLRVGK